MQKNSITKECANNCPTLKIILIKMVMLATTSLLWSAKSVSQHGITWTWIEDRQVGQYANGDWWVVGPITLTGPVSTDGTNGTMINPAHSEWSTHGFDYRVDHSFHSQYPAYSGSRNRGTQMPIAVGVNSTVVSVRSFPEIRLRNQIESTAILTVVASPPPPGSFRPGYFDDDKTTRFNISQIDYSKLQRLPLVAGANRANAERMLARPMFNIGSRFNSNYLLGWNDTPYSGRNYGREITLGIAIVALELNLNYTDEQKQLMAIRMIQHGLDYYSGIIRGQRFLANGGHQSGRKTAVAMAGLLLNDAAILDRLDPVKYPGTFAEDTQHFRVRQQDIDAPRTGHHPLYPQSDPQPYPQSALGMAEWGPDGGYPRTTAGYNWNRVYREVVCPSCAGQALGAILSGLETHWRHTAFFEYYRQRAVAYYQSQGKLNPFVSEMWKAYGNVFDGSTGIDPPGNTNPPTEKGFQKTLGIMHSDYFTLGQRVETIQSLQIHEHTALNSKVHGVVAPKSVGTVIEKASADGLGWVKVKFENGLEGWTKLDVQILKIDVDGQNVSRPINDYGVNFTEGDRIKVVQPAHVRTDPKSSSNLLGIQQVDAKGTVTALTVLNDDQTTWARVKFDNGIEGWCMVGVKRSLIDYRGD